LPAAGTISKPGDDPFVITVGSTDDSGTVGTGDDRLPNFSAHGPTAADGISKPDIAAPGAHIVSLRAPGSSIDTLYPNFIDGAYRKGSGTSMAAAAVSGSIATLLQANPTWSPDRVKYAIKATARRSASDDPQAVGAGLLDVTAARTAPLGYANVGLQRSSGMGSLDASRGTVELMTTDPTGTLLSGLTTAQLLVWDPIGYTTGDWNGYSWHTSQWYGYSWHATQWYGYSWHGYSWHGSTMNGQSDESSWYGYSWHGSAWYGAWE
jgi:serine protease AprX